MEKSLKSLNTELGTSGQGRANPKLNLDKIMVDYYGTMTPIPQVGNLAVPGAEITYHISLGRFDDESR